MGGKKNDQKQRETKISEEVGPTFQNTRLMSKVMITNYGARSKKNLPKTREKK